MNNIEEKDKKIEDQIDNKNENINDLEDIDNSKEDLPINENNNLNNDEEVEVEISKEQELEEEIEKLRDEKLRLLAEMDNLRKRVDRDQIDAVRYGSFNLARDILSPDDNLSRALEVIPDEVGENSDTFNNLIDGLKMVQKEFASILKKHGIKKIEAINNKFDHNFHQAMVEIENDDVDAGMVIQEMQSGYTMFERLLRPSMVGVSKKKTKDQKDEKKG